MTDDDLTRIYNQANSIANGKHVPITTARIFAAMRAAMAIADERADYAWRNTHAIEKARQEEMAKRDALTLAMRDVFPAAHRLALELECLLLDTKDTVAVSKWWDSAHEALEQWREFLREDASKAAVPPAPTSAEAPHG